MPQAPAMSCNFLTVRMTMLGTESGQLDSGKFNYLPVPIFRLVAPGGAVVKLVRSRGPSVRQPWRQNSNDLAIEIKK